MREQLHHRSWGYTRLVACTVPSPALACKILSHMYAPFKTKKPLPSADLCGLPLDRGCPAGHVIFVRLPRLWPAIVHTESNTSTDDYSGPISPPAICSQSINQGKVEGHHFQDHDQASGCKGVGLNIRARGSSWQNKQRLNSTKFSQFILKNKYLKLLPPDLTFSRYNAPNSILAGALSQTPLGAPSSIAAFQGSYSNF